MSPFSTLCLKVAKIGTVDAPREQMFPIDFYVTLSKVRVKMLASVQLLSISYLIPCLKVAKLGTVDALRE